MKNTLVVNLLGAPSAGKSTMTAYLFSILKWKGYDAEIVAEFAKELVWEERHETFKDELYIFSKQNHRLFRVNGKVDIIITDRPIILSQFYNSKYGDNSQAFKSIVLHEHHKYQNFNIFLDRAKPYNPNGRNQTEEQSDVFSLEIIDMLKSLNIEYSRYYGNIEDANKIVKIIENMINERNKNAKK